MNSDKLPLIVLTGPTAVGKTALSIELARRVKGQIISADSMQIYKYMDIGTAKIKPEEMNGIKHYLIDELEPDQPFNVTVFKEMAVRAMQEIRKSGYIPIITGGTGFYIQSVLYDIEFEDNNNDTSYRQELYEIANTKGAEYLHDMLKTTDPESARDIHANNVKRVVRALEYYRQTGRKISEHNKEQRENDSPYNYAYFVLNDEREHLYNRINQRVDEMFDSGLINEVKVLKEKGYTCDMVSMQGIGYKEVLDYFDGMYDLEELRNVIKKDTRHLAKRQLTWFRREKSVNWVNVDELSYDSGKILDYMLDILRKKGVISDNEEHV
ncbi:MAG: tRNA (adenosine(37)-N6)-dimethylallyltransferase MiaA [Eubacteriales bacterium]|nr:tRNA (adenosine(37)-N6)-dimethylallyltransferase MiaA [Eubacteriales bacterium]